jgi:hypothetical protein
VTDEGLAYIQAMGVISIRAVAAGWLALLLLVLPHVARDRATALFDSEASFAHADRTTPRF